MPICRPCASCWSSRGPVLLEFGEDDPFINVAVQVHGKGIDPLAAKPHLHCGGPGILIRHPLANAAGRHQRVHG